MAGSHPVPGPRGPSVWPSALLAVVSGGWIAGTIDIASASLINALPPHVILRAIASGVLGPASFHDGPAAAVAGLFLQWAMSLVIAAVYVGAVILWPKLDRRPVGGGVAYGIVIYVVMNYVVVPLSAAPFGPPTQPLKRLENLLAMALFGVIVAAAARLAGVGGRARRARSAA